MAIETSRQADVQSSTSDGLALIDWSKLPVDTLFIGQTGDLLRLSHIEQGSGVVAFQNGRDRLTGHSRMLHKHERAKLAVDLNFRFWQGGERPLPAGIVFEFVIRSGVGFIASHNIDHLDWTHNDTKDDIIAYRIIGAAHGYSEFFEGRSF